MKRCITCSDEAAEMTAPRVDTERSLALGEDAAGTRSSVEIVGEVAAAPAGLVLVQSGFGGRRVLDQLVGDPLPRIC